MDLPAAEDIKERCHVEYKMYLDCVTKSRSQGKDDLAECEEAKMKLSSCATTFVQTIQRINKVCSSQYNDYAKCCSTNQHDLPKCDKTFSMFWKCAESVER